MKDDHEALNQMGLALANHFACVYYVDIETGSYSEYVYTEAMDKAGLPVSGEDYFADFHTYASRWIHPKDLEFVLCFHNKKDILKNISCARIKNTSYAVLKILKKNFVQKNNKSRTFGPQRLWQDLMR